MRRALLEGYGEATYLLGDSGRHTYAELCDGVETARRQFREQGVRRGDVIAMRGDFDHDSIRTLLALMRAGCIVVPIRYGVLGSDFYRDAHVEKIFDPEDGVAHTLKARDRKAPKLYRHLRRRRLPGLVLTSSGSSGKPKVVVHDGRRFLAKYGPDGKRLRTLAYLMFDHVGGLNTLFYTLAAGGTLIVPRSRRPSVVMEEVSRYGVELLPVTPTFLNMALVDGGYEGLDMSSLRCISYGTEPMPPSVLDRLGKAFPGVRLKQTYGLSETGILSTRSESDASLRMRLDPRQYKVVDGTLRLRTRTSMLGYLNAPSPFDRQGYFDTQDRVTVEGGYVRVLGKDSDTINVGGLKVSPVEVESVLLACPLVEDCVVYGERSALTGQVVCADVTPKDVDAVDVQLWCMERLRPFAVPRKLRAVRSIPYTERLKKARPNG